MCLGNGNSTRVYPLDVRTHGHLYWSNLFSWKGEALEREIQCGLNKSCRSKDI